MRLHRCAYRYMEDAPTKTTEKGSHYRHVWYQVFRLRMVRLGRIPAVEFVDLRWRSTGSIRQSGGRANERPCEPVSFVAHSNKEVAERLQRSEYCQIIGGNLTATSLQSEQRAASP